MTTRYPIGKVVAWAWLIAFAGSAMMAGQTAQASSSSQQGSGVTLTARAGFDGRYKDGQWIPIRITVANDGPDISGALRIVAPFNYGSAETVYTRAVELPTQSRREIFLYIAPDSFLSSLKVTLVDQANKLKASRDVRLTQTGTSDILYGVLAASPSAFSALNDIDPLNGAAYVAPLEPGDLPPVGEAWQALDVLVISDVDTGVLTSEQRTALANWVAGGGRLIVAGGPGWQKTTAGLGALVPIEIAGTRTVTHLESLAAFAAAATPEGSAVVAEGTPAADAVAVASADGAPLILSRRYGFGQVVFLAADPAFAPFKGWDGVEGLFRNLLAVPLDRPAWAGGMRNWSSAQQAVNALPALELPSVFLICGFLGLYLVVIGPLNYLVLRRIRRRELAWLTIPAIVIVFSGVTYTADYQLRGSQALLHQLTLVQVWPDADQAQVDQIAGVFSPRRATYDVQFTPGLLVRPIPNSGGIGSPGEVTLEQADATTILDLNTDVASVEAFAVQGQIPAPHFESNLALEVSGTSIKLDGTITNLSDLTLTDVVLLGPGGPSGVQRLGEFKPGDTRTISLFLYTARASQASPNAILPVLPSTGTVAPSTYYPPSNYDSTVDDILGSTNYYSDQKLFRRYMLLTSAMDPYGGFGRGNGLYLAGWTEAAPISGRVLGQTFSTLDATLYLITLRPTLNLGEQVITVPPGLMTWSVVDPGQTGTAQPYDMSVYPGYDNYVLRFAPAQLILFRHVQQLTLHLKSYGATGVVDANIELWDFSEHTWVPSSPVYWGDNEVQAPARFVGPSGEIQVRVRLASTSSQLSLEALDFTLVVEP